MIMAGDNATPGSSFNDSYEAIYEDPYLKAPVKGTLITIFVAIFALGFFGNILVVYVIARNKSMHTVTNFFLANLALADLLVAIFCVIPQLLWYVMDDWPLGDAVCRIHKYMMGAATSASILILTVISVERYIAILHPLETRRVLTTRRLTITVMLVWLLSAVVNIPALLFHETRQFYGDKTYCSASDMLTPKVALAHSLTNFTFFYAIPLAIMSVLYGIISRKLWTTSTGKRVFTGSDNGGFRRGTGSRFTSRITGRFSRSKSTSDGSSSKTTPGNIYRPDNDKEGTVVLEMNRVGTKDGMIKSKLEEVTKADDEIPRNQKIGPFFVHEPSMDEDTPVAVESDTKLPLMNEGNNNAQGQRQDCKPVAIVSSSNRAESRMKNPSLSRNQSSMSVGKTTVPGERPSKRTNDEITNGRTRGKGRDNVMKARKKVIRLLVLIVASFALCLFPVQLHVFLQAFNQDSIFQSPGGLFFQPLSHALYFFNSAINPFLYAFFSDNFRAKFKQTFKLRSRRNRMSASSKSGLQRLHSMTSYAQTEVVYVSS